MVKVVGISGGQLLKNRYPQQGGVQFSLEKPIKLHLTYLSDTAFFGQRSFSRKSEERAEFLRYSCLESH